MKAVILAGGLGTRLAEETVLRPKPMVRIGPHPILWHIMKIYSAFGVQDFIICTGYKGYMIKEYFANYPLHVSDVTIDLRTRETIVHQNTAEPWRVTLVDTGLETATGGRLKRVREYLDPDEPFCFTYGDGVADIDVTKLLAFHRAHGRLATITAVRPTARFGALALEDDRVKEFVEKPQSSAGWINGGFFVFEPGVLDYIEGDSISLEREPLENIARDEQLMAYRHEGFWQPMDTLREKRILDALWESGKAPWRSW
jgi:glucose-1-phosphate cytidylyltransferase